ncbi:ABC transporter ATP-binding protein [Granulicoccus phenolivorans]|uniref:ABC transporter ATP-binding protein n=1 Tax=Granulicoccus phenolivorans TaxID=266854 RepID=UPI00040C5E8A|nr:ABC transporter ATP-binding protein [Granulicoccus phenolivorans]
MSTGDSADRGQRQGHVAVRDLQAGYGDTTILDLEHLDIQPGEFLSVLGPSGCGKTTLLNVIAGFVPASRGQVLVDGRDVTDEPAYRRGLGLVFQGYALFPHLTVAQNIAYGLRVRKESRAAVTRRVNQALALVDLVDFADRRPRQLSGGQQQRVALARALAYEPSVLLLDEPLSNLDAKLRRQMQFELRRIHKAVGTTMIFVTHDQDEALTMSDRVALLNAGKIEQIGTPEEIYRQPRTAFVADFLGAGNLIPATIADGRAVTPEGAVLPANAAGHHGEVTVVLRREQITLADPGATDPVVIGPSAEVADPTLFPVGEVLLRAFSGGTWHLQVRVGNPEDGGQVFSVELADAGPRRTPPPEGSTVRVVWDPTTTLVIER